MFKKKTSPLDVFHESAKDLEWWKKVQKSPSFPDKMKRAFPRITNAYEDVLELLHHYFLIQSKILSDKNIYKERYFFILPCCGEVVILDEKDMKIDPVDSSCCTLARMETVHATFSSMLFDISKMKVDLKDEHEDLFQKECKNCKEKTLSWFRKYNTGLMKYYRMKEGGKIESMLYYERKLCPLEDDFFLCMKQVTPILWRHYDWKEKDFGNSQQIKIWVFEELLKENKNHIELSFQTAYTAVKEVLHKFVETLGQPTTTPEEDDEEEGEYIEISDSHSGSRDSHEEEEDDYDYEDGVVSDSAPIEYESGVDVEEEEEEEEEEEVVVKSPVKKFKNLSFAFSDVEAFIPDEEDRGNSASDGSFVDFNEEELALIEEAREMNKSWKNLSNEEVWENIEKKHEANKKKERQRIEKSKFFDNEAGEHRGKEKEQSSSELDEIEIEERRLKRMNKKKKKKISDDVDDSSTKQVSKRLKKKQKTSQEKLDDLLKEIDGEGEGEDVFEMQPPTTKKQLTLQSFMKK